MKKSKRIVNIGDKFGDFTIIGYRFRENGTKYFKIEVECKCGQKSFRRYDELPRLNMCRDCHFESRYKFKIGDQVGNFKILGFRKNAKTNLHVRCICGTEYFTNTCGLKITKKCKICKFQKLGHEHASYKGTRYVSKKEFSNIQRNAQDRNLEFSLDIEYLDALMQKQNHKCAYSGLEIFVGNSKFPKTASLDRIDNSKGYIKGNVQWVHKDVNKMKNVYSEEYFLELIKSIYMNMENNELKA